MQMWKKIQWYTEPGCFIMASNNSSTMNLFKNSFLKPSKPVHPQPFYFVCKLTFPLVASLKHHPFWWVFKHWIQADARFIDMALIFYRALFTKLQRTSERFRLFRHQAATRGQCRAVNEASGQRASWDAAQAMSLFRAHNVLVQEEQRQLQCSWTEVKKIRQALCSCVAIPSSFVHVRRSGILIALQSVDDPAGDSCRLSEEVKLNI